MSLLITTDQQQQLCIICRDFSIELCPTLVSLSYRGDGDAGGVAGARLAKSGRTQTS